MSFFITGLSFHKSPYPTSLLIVRYATRLKGKPAECQDVSEASFTAHTIAFN